MSVISGYEDTDCLYMYDTENVDRLVLSMCSSLSLLGQDVFYQPDLFW